MWGLQMDNFSSGGMVGGVSSSPTTLLLVLLLHTVLCLQKMMKRGGNGRANVTISSSPTHNVTAGFPATVLEANEKRWD